jgi:hypothetical protein
MPGLGRRLRPRPLSFGHRRPLSSIWTLWSIWNQV